jgi:precorrin-6B methylase 1
MPSARAAAEAKLARHFAPSYTDAAHARKRAAAELVAIHGINYASHEFNAAAAIEGMSAQQLAAAIIVKPDEVLARDNERRRLVKAVRAAADPAAIADILTKAGING